MAENYITCRDEKGTVNISAEVVAVIVSAALEELAGEAVVTNVTGPELNDLLGKKPVQKGIKVSFEEGRVLVDAVLLVRFGGNISEIAERAQKTVQAAVESMTGIATIVNVHISGVIFDK